MARVAEQRHDAEVTRRRRERRGWYLTWWANHGFQTTVITVFLGPYLTTVAKAAADAHGDVHPLGIPVRAGSFFPYVVSLSVILQVVTLPIVGAMADRARHKKSLLAASAVVGGAATTGMYFLHGTNYLLGGALFVVGNVAYGASDVVGNSYLPEIAAPGERNRVSSAGYAWGYVGGGLLLVAHLVLYTAHDSFGLTKGEAVRIALASAGVWWLVFITVPLRRLRDTPPATAATLPAALRASLAQLRGTATDLVRRHRITLTFILAFLLYNDGIQTVITLSATYGSQELKLSQSVLIEAILLVQFVAFGGAVLLGRMARVYGAKRMVLGTLAAWVLILAAAYLLRAGQTLPFFGLAFAIGLVLGGSQALSRSLYTHLIPAGRTAEYFGLYELSDKGTSWLGPLVFGLALQLTGSYRSAIISLIVFFVAGFVLLAAVNVPRGIREAGNPVPEEI